MPCHLVAGRFGLEVGVDWFLDQGASLKGVPAQRWGGIGPGVHLGGESQLRRVRLAQWGSVGCPGLGSQPREGVKPRRGPAQGGWGSTMTMIMTTMTHTWPHKAYNHTLPKNDQNANRLKNISCLFSGQILTTPCWVNAACSPGSNEVLHSSLRVAEEQAQMYWGGGAIWQHHTPLSRQLLQFSVQCENIPKVCSHRCVRKICMCWFISFFYFLFLSFFFFFFFFFDEKF